MNLDMDRQIHEVAAVWALRYARGRVLDVRVEAETYPIAAAGLQADFARNDQVPFIDLVATHDAPRRVAPQRLEPPAPGGRMTFKLPPRSYTVAQLATV